MGIHRKGQANYLNSLWIRETLVLFVKTKNQNKKPYYIEKTKSLKLITKSK